MMTTSAVKTALQPLSGKEIDRLATASGVPVPTIYKIKSGETPDPRGSTIESLSDAFEAACAGLLEKSNAEPQKVAA